MQRMQKFLPRSNQHWWRRSFLLLLETVLQLGGLLLVPGELWFWPVPELLAMRQRPSTSGAIRKPVQDQPWTARRRHLQQVSQNCCDTSTSRRVRTMLKVQLRCLPQVHSIAVSFKPIKFLLKRGVCVGVEMLLTFVNKFTSKNSYFTTKFIQNSVQLYS